ncbi:MAG: bifunctional diaminohydroxyphosphoribosylaminopyrimidine deaminase/5-amino-6-(5-phosphoribosylamino)uracil reductase RibD, partial [Acidimicrobiales bacterium]|nr:bifunctional diaminohydroxyphosphoribosylaminopyrimidine deaminase/5-amino-6-(5-phosphoribosylamino)uracil reductase RibD [Acidimicrobiales bacterium]
MIDDEAMRLAIDVAAGARAVAHPNPWVGCVLLTTSGRVVTGATHAPGGHHAEAAALEAAGPDARGSTVIVTLEPCCFEGRTPACARALIDAGVRRVVVGLLDPDHRVHGQGVAMLSDAGIEVTVG